MVMLFKLCLNAVIVRPIIFAVFFLFCFQSNVDAAKFAGESFSLGVGARALALGGGVVAGPFDGSAPYWNPAGMNYLHGRQLIAMHAETFGSLLNHDFLAYSDSRQSQQGNNSSSINAFGFYLYYLGGGGIKITRLNQFNRPEVIREESHGDWLFSAALSGKISGKIDFGLTGKIIYRDLGTETGYGLTVDAGTLYRVNRHLNLGLMVTDITTGFIRYSGNTELYDTSGNIVERGGNSESIYPTVKPGFMFEYTIKDFTGRMVTSGDIKFEGIKAAAQYWVGRVSLDTHYGWELGYQEILFGRFGFDIGRFTAGGGVNLNRIKIDFAYLHHDDLDETFRVSAEYGF